MALRDNALTYHQFPKPGKLEISPTKPCETARDLSLAYSPGVSEPCLSIAANPDDVYKYTSKGNLVAVITNGTAVLGLGDIGPLASKPVMEGKAVLFKTFADVDVFDIELDCKSVDEFVSTVCALAPTFGGINLEDIKAPECFEIEAALKARLSIPVFHDDQHGTAIIAGAALLNALELTHRDIREIKIVVNGAGAAAIACSQLLLSMGAQSKNLILCDSKGVVYQGRVEGMNKYKAELANDTSARTLADALKSADVFLGLSVKNMMTPEMLLSMAQSPIVFAMANPDPEIEYPLAKATRADAILATGRSDYPNQVNNVLGFPFIFRGALDVRATSINEDMKMAAVRALAQLAREPVPESVSRAYGSAQFTFGPDYLIPKPFDPRVLYYVAPAVAKAAMESGLARTAIDLESYTLSLKEKQNKGRVILRGYYQLARKSARKRIAFSEATNPRVLKAAGMARAEDIAQPVLLGNREEIVAAARECEVDLNGVEIIEPAFDPRLKPMAESYFRAREAKGVSLTEAAAAVQHDHIFASMMLSRGEVDGVICGVDRDYSSMVRPILSIVGLRKGCVTAAGMYILSIKNRLIFIADASINIEMTKEKLAAIALMTAEFAASMNIVPRVALLSFSNFGAVNHPLSQMVRDARDIALQRSPHLLIDGEMQADTAVMSELLRELYPTSKLPKRANVLIFPDMQSANISYKLLQQLGGARVVGPIILGLKAPAYVMQRHAAVDEIFNMITAAVAQASLGSVEASDKNLDSQVEQLRDTQLNENGDEKLTTVNSRHKAGGTSTQTKFKPTIVGGKSSSGR